MPPELSPLETELLAALKQQASDQERRHQESLAVFKAHNAGAELRHKELMKALSQRDGATVKALKDLKDDDQRWGDRLEAAAAWLGPKLWELLRTPMGALLVGILLAQLSRALDIAPADLLQFLGVAPIPEPAKNEQFLGAPTIPEPAKNEEQ
jgi:hypothetical protein